MTTSVTAAVSLSSSGRRFYFFVAASAVILMITVFSFNRLTMEKSLWHTNLIAPKLVGVDLRMAVSENLTRSTETKKGNMEQSRGDINESISFPALASFDIGTINASEIGRYTCQQQQGRLGSSGQYTRVPQSLQPALSKEERALLLLNLQTVVRSLERHNLTYFLYGGSLIGSYRHHGLIPWDDDVDIMLNNSQKREIKDALSDIVNFTLTCDEHWTWKFFWSGGLPGAKRTSVRLPFIDIFFFEENVTHIWDRLGNYKQDYVFPKWAVFPLVRRPVEGAWLAVPRDTGWVLSKTYNTSQCQSLSWCHKFQQKMKEQVSVPCQELHHFFPFVSRSRPRPGVLRETLLLGDRVVQSFDFPDPFISRPLPASSQKITAQRKSAKNFLSNAKKS